jgi:hypothetical protein
MGPLTRAVEIDWVKGKRPDEGLYPAGHTVADGELAGLGRTVGTAFRVTGHVLRRSFGRLAYQAGVPVPTIQRIFGHVSVDQTLHFIGIGQEEMTEGFVLFDPHMRASPEDPASGLQPQTASSAVEHDSLMSYGPSRI